ncbi:hypothetical protein DSUL_50392 [Desulfovibrionales bacterium]
MTNKLASCDLILTNEVIARSHVVHMQHKKIKSSLTHCMVYKEVTISK